MFHTARTSARTMLVVAGAAGFVALGSGIAGADTLGGVTDGLPLNELSRQVPAALTEGVGTPIGDLVKVEPGEVSARPEVQQQSAEAVGNVFGDAVSATTPVETGEENAAKVGLIDLGEVTERLPLSEASQTRSLSGSGAVDPLSGLLDGIELLDVLSSDGAQTLPLGHEESTRPLASHTAVVDDTVRELGSRVQYGVREGDPRLFTLDEVNLDAVGGTVPMSGPIVLDTGENADLTGGLTTLLPADVNEKLPMSGPESLDVERVAGEVTGAADDLLPRTPGGDLVDVQGLPRLGAPRIGVDQLSAPDGLPLGEGSVPELDLPVGLV